MIKRGYLTPKEVADLLMVSTAAIRLWAEKGQLKAMTTLGGHRRFKLEDVSQFAEQNQIPLDSSIFESPLSTELRRILIVDDEQMYAEYLKTVIELADESVIIKICHNGFEAGIQLRDFAPDTVLLDLKMPGVDGFGVCRYIRTDPSNREIKVIAMTGQSSSENRRKIEEAGADAYLAKPIDTAYLLELLELNTFHKGSKVKALSAKEYPHKIVEVQ